MKVNITQGRRKTDAVLATVGLVIVALNLPRTNCLRNSLRSDSAPVFTPRPPIAGETVGILQLRLILRKQDQTRW